MVDKLVAMNKVFEKIGFASLCGAKDEDICRADSIEIGLRPFAEIGTKFTEKNISYLEGRFGRSDFTFCSTPDECRKPLNKMFQSDVGRTPSINRLVRIFHPVAHVMEPEIFPSSRQWFDQ